MQHIAGLHRLTGRSMSRGAQATRMQHINGRPSSREAIASTRPRPCLPTHTQAAKLPPPLFTLPTRAAREAALLRSLRQARVQFHPDKARDAAACAGCAAVGVRLG